MARCKLLKHDVAMFLVQFYALIPPTSCNTQLCFLDCTFCLLLQKKKAASHITHIVFTFHFWLRVLNVFFISTYRHSTQMPRPWSSAGNFPIYPTQWDPLCVMYTELKRDDITSLSTLFGSLVCFKGLRSIDALRFPLVKIVRAVVTPFQSFVCTVFICCNTNMFSHLGSLAKV